MDLDLAFGLIRDAAMAAGCSSTQLGWPEDAVKEVENYAEPILYGKQFPKCLITPPEGNGGRYGSQYVMDIYLIDTIFNDKGENVLWDTNFSKWTGLVGMRETIMYYLRQSLRANNADLLYTGTGSDIIDHRFDLIVNITPLGDATVHVSFTITYMSEGAGTC